MNLQIKYVIAGFCMGIAELIPGISGSTIAVVFKIYKNLMTILSELKWSNVSLNLPKLSKTFQFELSLPLFLSMAFSIFICSKGIDYLLSNYEQYFLSLLGWLMIILSIFIVNFFKSVTSEYSLIIFLFIGILVGFLIQNLNLSESSPGILFLFISGILAFSFFLIPGISGSAMLVILGVYGTVIQAIAYFNFEVLIPFALGCLLSLVLLPRLILNLYSKYEQKLLFLFSGLIFTSGYFLI